MTQCLVTEAKEKCQCDFCKQMRGWREIVLKQIVQWEAYKIWRDSF